MFNPFSVEKILLVAPQLATYHRNQRAETSEGSEVTFTFTNIFMNDFKDLKYQTKRYTFNIDCVEHNFSIFIFLIYSFGENGSEMFTNSNNGVNFFQITIDNF